MFKEEKKVEYLELIYDLIFVYIIGRNNSLLHNIENGFVSAPTLLSYILYSLAVIQIWNFTTCYINMYGRNGVRDHIAIFINMYLLYYIAEGTRLHWESFMTQYHVAWALILVNIGLQYLLEEKNHKEDEASAEIIRRMALIPFCEAVLVILCLPLYKWTGTLIAAVPVLFGILANLVISDERRADMVDFSHLSERAMLFVVFTFGEMIIAIAPYFDGPLTAGSLYYSGMSFLIVVGLFLSYEMVYNRIIDRNRRTTGLKYMLIHIFLIFGMNSITAALEFMRNVDVALWPKIILLVLSFLIYFFCLFALQIFAKPQFKLCRMILIPVGLCSAIFTLLIILLRNHMWANILVSVLYAYGVFIFIYRFSRQKGPCVE